jgi:nucleotide-binding universal stress UspA family protein
MGAGGDWPVPDAILMSEDDHNRSPVIVGVDGSERSVDALALADVLGPALGRAVLIVFVHSYGQLSGVFSQSEADRVVREVAESTFDQVREHLPSVPERRMHLVSGKSPAAGLHALAERDNAALVVLGSSHRSTIGRILIGGTAERLLSGAPAPVAIAPAGYAAAEKRIDLVGCGFDGSQESHRALAWSSELARTTGARLHVLSVFEPTFPATLAVGGGLTTSRLNDVLRAQLHQELEQATATLQSRTKFEASLVEGDAAEVLARASADLDLLVVGSRGYGPLGAVLLGSVSTALGRSAQSPLVVVPRGADAESAG